MPYVITGAGGQLGPYVLRRLRSEGGHLVAWSGGSSGDVLGVPLRAVDFADRDAVAAAFRSASPDAVIHCAAVTSVGAAHRDPQRARAVNTAGTQHLAELAAQRHCRFVHLSTDMVFDGEKGCYREEDTAAPLSVYGRTKLDAEPSVLALDGGVVLRVSLMFGPSLTGRGSFFDQQLAALRGGGSMRLFDDEWRTPLGLADAAEAVVAAARSDVAGLFHVGGPERMSRYEMGCRLANALDADPSVFERCSRLSVDAAEPRAADLSLDSSRWCKQFPNLPRPNFEDSLRVMLSQP